jgi:hypothetical protein
MNSPIEILCETHTSIRTKKIYNKKLFKYLYPDPDKFDRIAYIKKLYTLAVLDNSNYIAYHQDAGHQDFKFVYEGITKDFEDAISNDEIHCLAVVPKEMIESWLLSDEKAYPSIPVSPALPKKPEEIWGDRHNPESNYPKNYFKRILSQYSLEDNHNIYTDIASKSDIETIKNRCPESFNQFCNDMQSFITGEPSQ